MKRKFNKEHIKKLAEHKRGKFGKQSCHWKGGRSIHSAGYVLIRSPEHPYKANGYVFEHRLVMERHIGRYLNPEEVVHHINGIRDDNRIENLVLTTNRNHPHYHRKYKNRPCLNCKTIIKYPRKKQIYCSEKCNYSHRWNKPVSHYFTFVALPKYAATTNIIIP